MKDIKELALRVAEEVGIKATFVCGKPDECPDDDGCCHHSVPDGRWLKQGKLEKFATRLIAAYCEGREPVSLYPCGFKELKSLVIKHGAYLARGMYEGEPVTESIRSAAMVLIGYAKDMSILLAKQPLYAAPPEPAPQQEPLHVGDSQFESWFSTYWSASLRNGSKQIARDAYAAGMGDPLVSPACAAPSSEEVRDAVARLNDRFYDLDEGDCRRISDLIEYLAARVPDGCVVVGYLDGRGRFFYADDPHMEIDHTGMREVFAAGDVK